MVEHYVQHMLSKSEKSIVGSLTYFFGLQAKQLCDIFAKALDADQFEKLRGLMRICMCEILLLLTQRRRARIKENFLSPIIIAAHKIREISSNLKLSHNHSSLSPKSNLPHFLYCSSTYVRLHISLTCSKMSQKFNEVNTLVPKPVTNSYGVKML